MLECPNCHRLYPEVVGAPTQVCPHCQHETTVEGDEAAASEAKARARSSAIPVDPVGAIQLSVRLSRRRYVRFLWLTFPAVAVYVGVTLVQQRVPAMLGLPVDEAAWTVLQLMQFAGVGLPLVLLWSTTVLASWAFVAREVFHHTGIPGEATTASAVPKKGNLLAPALVAGFALTLAFIAGAMLLLVGLFVVLHWFMFVPAEVGARRRPLGEAFDASRKFARERRIHGFTALIVVVGVVALLPFVVYADPTLPQLITVSLVGWLLAPWVPLLIASFLALSTGKVAFDKTPKREAPTKPPSQEAKPVARAGRTACPACGTAIEYTPTGFPVDVVCPSCGKAGRVL